MRDKKWRDCPSCGRKNAMVFKKDVYDKVVPKGYLPLRVGPLCGYFCPYCKEGFLTRASENLMDSQIAEHKAKIDSGKTVASSLMTVPEAVQVLKKSRQWVHKLMRNGAISYVFIGDQRFPKRESVIRYKSAYATR